MSQCALPPSTTIPCPQVLGSVPGHRVWELQCNGAFSSLEQWSYSQQPIGSTGFRRGQDHRSWVLKWAFRTDCTGWRAGEERWGHSQEGRQELPRKPSSLYQDFRWGLSNITASTGGEWDRQISPTRTGCQERSILKWQDESCLYRRQAWLQCARDWGQRARSVICKGAIKTHTRVGAIGMTRKAGDRWQNPTMSRLVEEKDGQTARAPTPGPGCLGFNSY